MNYFELFNLEKKFDINLDDLDKNYFMMQKKFHPDQQDKSQNIYNSVLLNDAYKIIKDDYLRSCYLLDIQNNENYLIEEEFLEEILNFNEILNDLSVSEELSAFKNSIENARNEILEKLSFFHNNKNIEHAKKYTIKLKYYDQLLLNIDKKLETCF